LYTESVRDEVASNDICSGQAAREHGIVVLSDGRRHFNLFFCRPFPAFLSPLQSEFPLKTLELAPEPIIRVDEISASSNMLCRIHQRHPMFLHQISDHDRGTSRHSSETMHQDYPTLLNSLLEEPDACLEMRFQVCTRTVQYGDYFILKIAGEFRWDS
jgi:hypothetical protein